MKGGYLQFSWREVRNGWIVSFGTERHGFHDAEIVCATPAEAVAAAVAEVRKTMKGAPEKKA